MTNRLKGGSFRKLLAIFVFRSPHGGLLTGRNSSVLILWLEFTVLADLVDRDEGVLTNDNVVCINQLCNIGARSSEVFGSQRAVCCVRQGVNRAVFTNLLTVRANPADLVITRERQCARQLDLRRLEVVDAFRKVCRVEVGIVIDDVQICDVGLNLSEVDVVPTLVGVARNTNCTAPVRVLTRIAVYSLEDGRREATEGVEDLAVILCPDVGVVLHAVADIVTHTDGVAAFGIGFGADGLEDRLLAVRAHVFDHGLGRSGLLTVRHIGDCQAIVFSDAVVGKNGGVDLRPLNRLIAFPLIKRAGLIAVRTAFRVGPDSTEVRVTRRFRSFRLMPAFLVHGKLRAHHVGVF